MSESERPTSAERPKDIHGNDVVMGPWYWAQERTGKASGAGKFLADIGWGKVRFWINGAGYEPDSFKAFELADPQPSFDKPLTSPAAASPEVIEPEAYSNATADLEKGSFDFEPKSESMIEEAVREHWGKRRSGCDINCTACQAWREFDQMKAGVEDAKALRQTDEFPAFMQLMKDVHAACDAAGIPDMHQKLEGAARAATMMPQERLALLTAKLSRPSEVIEGRGQRIEKTGYYLKQYIPTGSISCSHLDDQLIFATDVRYIFLGENPFPPRPAFVAPEKPELTDKQIKQALADAGIDMEPAYRRLRKMISDAKGSK